MHAFLANGAQHFSVHRFNFCTGKEMTKKMCCLQLHNVLQM